VWLLDGNALVVVLTIDTGSFGQFSALKNLGHWANRAIVCYLDSCTDLGFDSNSVVVSNFRGMAMRSNLENVSVANVHIPKHFLPRVPNYRPLFDNVVFSKFNSAIDGINYG